MSRKANRNNSNQVVRGDTGYYSTRRIARRPLTETEMEYQMRSAKLQRAENILSNNVYVEADIIADTRMEYQGKLDKVYSELKKYKDAEKQQKQQQNAQQNQQNQQNQKNGKNSKNGKKESANKVLARKVAIAWTIVLVASALANPVVLGLVR